MGIYLSSAAPIVRPEERVEHIQIPGRSGDLTMLEGTNIYNSYIQTVTIHVKNANNVRRVYDWLRGSGFVTFSGEPDRKQAARVIGAITLNKASRNLDIWVGEVQFYCQPLKERLFDVPVTLSAAGSILNLGDVAARPYYKITTSASTVVLTVSRSRGSSTSHESLTITGVSTGTTIYVDSASMEVLNYTGAVSLTPSTSGDFPVLEPGSNSVGGSGWSAIEITKRERFL